MEILVVVLAFENFGFATLYLFLVFKDLVDPGFWQDFNWTGELTGLSATLSSDISILI